MKEISDYVAEHWTSATAEADYQNREAVVITVDDRAATRQAIITSIRRLGTDFIERSDWAARPVKLNGIENDWNYSKIAVHHAGRSFSCGPAALQLQDIQASHRRKWSDIGYHYAISCSGQVYEGRDIRFKGSHLVEFNTGIIGIVLLENLADPDESDDGVGRVLGLLQALGGSTAAVAPEAQQVALGSLVRALKDFFKISELGGHREFPRQNGAEARLCPGRHGMKIVQSLRSRLALSSPSQYG